MTIPRMHITTETFTCILDDVTHMVSVVTCVTHTVAVVICVLGDVTHTVSVVTCVLGDVTHTVSVVTCILGNVTHTIGCSPYCVSPMLIWELVTSPILFHTPLYSAG